MFNLSLYRVPATGGPAERIGAGPTSSFAGSVSTFIAALKPHADMTGTRIVFGGSDDPTEQNPDYSSELWTVDMAKELARFKVPHELVTVTGAGHGLSGGDKKLVGAAHAKALAFIRTQMKGGK